MSALALGLLGPRYIRLDGVDVHLPALKAQALLFYLAAHPGQAFFRAQLVNLLWEESSERDGRNSLSTVLVRLRQALPDLPIAAEADCLTWQPQAAVWVDCAAFAALVAEGDRLGDLARLEEAAALWRGPLLDGFSLRDSVTFEDWLRVERERWQQRGLNLLHHLVDLSQKAGDPERALRHAQRALAIDPLQESFHRAVMRIHSQTGNRAAALAQYATCKEILLVELGAEPDPETADLAEAISQGKLARPGVSTTSAGQPPRPSLPPPPPVLRRQPAPALVGRERELASLLQHLTAAAAGQGKLVVIQGEAGIGKSRLVEELLWRLQPEDAADRPSSLGGWTILTGHCYESARQLPYRPLVEALGAVQPYLNLDTLGVPDVWLAEVNRLLPELNEQRPDLPTPPRLDPAQEQRRLFEGMTRFIAAICRPLLLVVEDLHWADEGTLNLLGFLLRHAETASVLVLATVREEDIEPSLTALIRGLSREGRLATIRPERLSADATVALLRELVREGTEQIGERLHRETEGNPLFAVEMVRSMIEAGALRVGPPGYPLGRVAGDIVELPDSIQAVIRSRLARLTGPARDFLNAAAVFGRGFDFDHARLVSGQSEDEALDALESLLQAQILREASNSVSNPGADLLYTFSHEKIQRVLYDELSGARRRILHRRALDALTASGQRVGPELLAYHAFRGQVWDQATSLSEQAAAAATQVFAYPTATALYLQALDALSHLPRDEALRRQEVDLRLRLAQVAFYAYPGRLLEWLGPAEGEARALDDQARLAQVWLAQASALYIQGQFTQALAMLERLVPIAEASGSDLLKARTFNILGRLLVLRGELERGVAVLDEAIPLLERVGSRGDAIVVRALKSSGHAYLGEFARAEASAQQAYQDSLAAGDPAAQVASLVFLEAIHQAWGHWTETVEYGRQGVAQARAAGNLIYEYNSGMVMGLALAHLGELDEAVRVQEHAIEIARQADIRVVLGRAHGWLGEIYLLAGRLADAERAASDGRQICLTNGYLSEQGLCERVLGEACLAQGDLAGAAEHLAAALDVLERCQVRPELVRTRLALSRLATAQGDSEAAAAQREAAQALHDAMGLDWPLAELLAGSLTP